MALSSRRFDPKACFIADDYEATKGWIATTRLPRDKWFVLRYLSVSRSSSDSQIAERLLNKAIEFVESENAEYVRATTPAIQSYVETYQKYGFKPVRRDFRVSWRLTDIPNKRDPRIEATQVSEDNIDQAGEILVRSLRPFWDWRTQEEGGSVVVSKTLREDQARGAKWLLVKRDQDIVGLTGIIPDYYGQGIGWFRGAMVLPEYRGRGIGSDLMTRISKIAQELGQTKMIVYTFSYLDSLAPGALLYLRTGGRIEAEYLQLARA